MQVFIMNGCARAGKDTVVGMISSIFQQEVKQFSHIDWAKDVIKYATGSVKKDKKSRKLMEDLENCFIEYNNHPYNVTTCAICKVYDEKEHDIITIDIRNPNEIKKIKNYCAAFHIPCFVLTIRNLIAEKNAKSLSKADNLWDQVPSDIVIYNNSDFKSLAFDVIDKLEKIVTKQNK